MNIIMLERYRQNSKKVEQNSKILQQTVHDANTSGVEMAPQNR